MKQKSGEFLTENHLRQMQIPKDLKIIGLTKVRNEEAIIKDTLDNWSNFCNGGIYVYDDMSEDKTVEICKAHPNVKLVLEGDFWDPDREKADYQTRQKVLLYAQQDADENTWFVYFDADEHLYNFDDFNLFSNSKAIACRLYDIYITPEDVEKNYKERDFIGPEFRTIIFFFKNSSYLSYDKPDQRIVNLPPDVGSIPIHGDIKHYGKGFSVKHWEDTCDYYITWWPKYAAKWSKRKGKAIHKDYLSDFGNRLLRWADRKQGFSLEGQPYGHN